MNVREGKDATRVFVARAFIRTAAPPKNVAHAAHHMSLVSSVHAYMHTCMHAYISFIHIVHYVTALCYSCMVSRCRSFISHSQGHATQVDSRLPRPQQVHRVLQNAVELHLRPPRLPLVRIVDVLEVAEPCAEFP